MNNKVRIGNGFIGEEYPVYIVAEGGLTNWGDIALAKRQVDAAMAAGADAIKFQAQTTEALVSKKVDPYWYSRLKYKELSYNDLRMLKEYCEIRNIDFFVTSHTEVDLEFIDKDLDIPFFKIGSGESINNDFLRNVASRGKPVIVSFGLHKSVEEIHNSLSIMESEGLIDIVALHCNTIYPTPVDINSLGTITQLKNQLDCPIGYSDHTIGLHIPIAAVALGAKLIEKHLSFDKTDKRSFDCPVSCDPEDLKQMVKQIRDVEASILPASSNRVDHIIAARGWASQSIVAAKDIPVGKVLERSDIVFKRPGKGLATGYVHKVLGKKVKKFIEEDTLVLIEDLY
ncbi:MAG: N-acylneuraminate-9-phosphate synthase [Candidatus Magasanikbacteria bacterium CG10_big_fil_rev_8_21_14_0_10_38_6]|uniref:N-acylneuraminate-9-phosphate synthase n=1 Tax=Candidatus Magasanikbacteria bacterium CG10_big_fil_rev_8_21_14_0_10_38_6 TaxID=1974647 RepID=A0A2M6P162_9BACT|nr:MAG: N-acylneuraminate-9-phosphate synthase [Candidatus Magasanikbacteria bacterium CG10_big_fil_rev_8_21_14_0_10_38_6]